MRQFFCPKGQLGPENISPNALAGNELVPPAVLARFLLLHTTRLTAKTVTAEDGTSWAEAPAEPFPALLGDVSSPSAGVARVHATLFPKSQPTVGPSPRILHQVSNSR
jgi:hypothetical protein